MKIAILISGRGSNMLRLADNKDNGGPGTATFEIVLVAANTPCDGLGLAAERGLPVKLYDRAEYPSRQAHETELADAIEAAGADLICLAGYMAILSAAFVDRFAGRIINIHPSLLPALKGLDTHARALADGMDRHGASVHLVTAALDDGPILLQAGLDIQTGEDADTLAARVLRLEHALYPFVLSALAAGTLSIADDGVTWQDGKTSLASAGPDIAAILQSSVIWPDQAKTVPK